MKRILIAGKDSYIGDQLIQRLDPASFQCDVLDMRTDAWRDCSCAGYDTAILVAGIAHRKATEQNRPLYDQVNHRLAVAFGQKAKQDGVKQLVFLSSMSVYGMEVGRIHADTPPHPATAYGRSKLNAETGLNAMADDNFHVAVLRPPMIYGPGCKGNYPRLSRLVQKLHVMPQAGNERSMLYIGTLCAFLENLLQSGEGGLYFPQNGDYVSTDALARAVAKAHQIMLWQPGGLGWLLRILGRNGGTIGKVFGTLTYDQTMSEAFSPENQPNFQQTIAETEAAK